MDGGGCFRLGANVTMNITISHFISNSAQNGGVVAILYSTQIMINDCVFINNHGASTADTDAFENYKSDKVAIDKTQDDDPGTGGNKLNFKNKDMTMTVNSEANENSSKHFVSNLESKIQHVQSAGLCRDSISSMHQAPPCDSNDLTDPLSNPVHNQARLCIKLY